MTATFETVTEDAITLKRGSEIHVRVQAFGDAETHYGIDVRRLITESTAEIKGGIVAGNGRTRSTYTGWTREGFFLSLWQTEALIDALTAAYMVAAAREDEANAELTREGAAA